ncbi:glycerol-3-phosphate acyltransferase [Chloroflexota bacterium]
MLTGFILLILCAYLLGSVPTAYLIARWRRKIDIRQYGSGNTGAANVLTVVSKRWSIPVTIFDIGKGALTVWIAQLLGLGAAQQVTVGIATVVGHNWPVFLRFQGGRGIFTSLGIITMLSWKLGLIGMVMSYALAPFRLLALGVTLTLSILPFFSWFLSQPLGIEERLPITLGFAALALIAVTRRLTTPRTPLSESVPMRQLIINRLLFDRDIKDRKAWIRQARTRATSTEQPFEQEEDQGSID